MSERISHSLLDPWLTKPLKGLYNLLPIPRCLPPEALVVCGHLAAVVGAIGFAFSTIRWWGGLLAAVGVTASHVADVLDGTHARATGQCRNGGELLDHFVDPLSFAYLVAGLAYSCRNELGVWLGMAGVTVIFATAVLTNICAKMTGEFALARFGPTEFKTLLVLFGLLQATGASQGWSVAPSQATLWFLGVGTAAGLVQLLVSLRRSIRQVNSVGAASPDTTEWEIHA